MKNYRGIAGLMTLALLVAGYLIQTAAKAKDTGDSAQVTQLLADAKAEAVELKNDSEHLEAISKSKLSWESYARSIEMIKEHVNNTGKLLAKLQDTAPSGSPWQQTAIQRIDPLPRELAANTETTINPFSTRIDPRFTSPSSRTMRKRTTNWPRISKPCSMIS